MQFWGGSQKLSSCICGSTPLLDLGIPPPSAPPPATGLAGVPLGKDQKPAVHPHPHRKDQGPGIPPSSLVNKQTENITFPLTLYVDGNEYFLALPFLLDPPLKISLQTRSKDTNTLKKKTVLMFDELGSITHVKLENSLVLKFTCRTEIHVFSIIMSQT